MQELPVTDVTPGAGAASDPDDLVLGGDVLAELDARAIPHAIRHGAVIGAFSQVRPGAAMVLAAPHNPLPLLAQLTEIEGDALEVTYLQQGPDEWRLRLGRR